MRGRGPSIKVAPLEPRASRLGPLLERSPGAVSGLLRASLGFIVGHHGAALKPRRGVRTKQ
eukprot:9493966-Pyramimonas_sp.AAC.1